VTAGDNTSGLDPANFTRWDGFYQNVQFDYYNPLAIQEQNINEGTSKTLNFFIKGDYEFIEGLNLDMSYAQQFFSGLQGRYWDKNSFWIGADRNGLAERNTDDRFTEIFETTLNYDHDFNEMNFKVLGGYSWQQNTNEGFGASGGNFVTDKFTYNNLSGAQDFDNGLGSVYSYKDRQTLIAFFGRVNFNWSDNYYLMASYRYEGSSRFGENNKWGGFPAISAGVSFSNLLDMGGAVDNLKLRLSYGETGTLPSESYLSLPRLGPTGNAFVNGSFQPAFGPVSNPNPNLKWETKKEFDIGVDFAFIDYRLTGSIDYYQRTTSDLLLFFDVPVPPNLFPQTWLNIGEMENNGFELGLSYLAVENSKVSYTTGLNFSTYNTKLNSLSSEEEGLQFGDRRIIGELGAPGQNGTFVSLVEEGLPIGNIWGPVIQEGQPVDENGDWNIVDTNGDGVIDQDDEQTIGNGLPTSELGWSNIVTVGNWDFNVFFRGVFGHDLLNTFRAFYENPNLIGSYNVLESSFDAELSGLNGNVNKYGSYHVESATFFKLDNLSVGYNFSLPDGAAFKKIRLYLTGQNLFVVSDYSGVDPEVRYADNGNVLSAGIDRRNTWFRTRTYTFGVQLGF
jgi:iron complex outermembrane receptor protein